MSFNWAKHLNGIMENARKNGTEPKLVLPVSYIGQTPDGLPIYALVSNTRKTKKNKEVKE